MKKQSGITLIALIITIIVMLILVGVTVNIALNGGLFDTAKQAVAGMNMAQIAKRAEMIKISLVADAETDSNITADIPTYRTRLIEELELEEIEGYSNNMLEVDGKYVIIIENSDLDILVVEKTKIPPKYLLISLGYEISDIEIDGKVYGKNVDINITRLMDKEQYIERRKEQDAGIQVSEETKKQAFLQYFYEYFSPEEEFTSIDEIVLNDVNYTYGTEYTTIEECLEDESVQADMGTTKEQLLYYLYTMYIGDIEDEDGAITEQEAINAYYEYETQYKYDTEYYIYTNNLSLYLVKDGEEQLLKNKINLRTEESITINYSTGENGTYNLILKNGRLEIAREVLRVNNLPTDKNPYYPTEEETVWTTDGAGIITGYTGTDIDIVIPIKIGNEYITKIGVSAFEGNTNITSVIMKDNITSIGNYAFRDCTSLVNIDFPDNLDSIGGEMLKGCISLKTVVLPAPKMDSYDFCVPRSYPRRMLKFNKCYYS